MMEPVVNGILRLPDFVSQQILLMAAMPMKKLLKSFFAVIHGCSYKSQLLASGIDVYDPDNTSDRSTPACVAHAVLWDDPLLGIYWNQLAHKHENFPGSLIEHYSNLATKLNLSIEPEDKGRIKHVALLAEFNAGKLAFRNELLEAYFTEDEDKLRKLVDDSIPELISILDKFSVSMRKNWLSGFKPFGLEVIQIRQAGQKARLLETAERINEFLDGKAVEIAELKPVPEAMVSAGICYRNIATGSCIF
ncbi:MAG: hypothetical protein GY750_08465 [Lentisphaerae bacterium]|nr:hypothetical protein [Lentisphaerota bacterium]MCP4101442.1 hypothetical protein [Lentisphaerota bacterium]